MCNINAFVRDMDCFNNNLFCLFVSPYKGPAMQKAFPYHVVIKLRRMQLYDTESDIILLLDSK